MQTSARPSNTEVRLLNGKFCGTGGLCGCAGGATGELPTADGGCQAPLLPEPDRDTGTRADGET